MSTHTPGPWRVAPASNYAGADINVDAGTRAFICVAGTRGDMEAEANAQLIAAAPELLAFAKWARDQFCGDSGTGYTHWEEKPQFMAGLKAIDAATLSERTEEAKGRPDARDTLREDGIRIPCNESLAQRAAKNQAPRVA